MPDGPPITLHSHSVDVVSVFLLEQYAYRRGVASVQAQPGDIVLDVGGCWGDTALYLANLVGPRGRVYTFEFDSESLNVLRVNLELNPGLAERIEIVEQPLWHTSGEELPFLAAGRMTTLLDTAGVDGDPRVRTTTLDDFVQRAGIDRVDFVKMDVEGSELNVLNGARQTLSSAHPRLALAAYHHDDDLVSLPAQIAALGAGYRMYLDTFSPVEEETVLFATAAKSSM